MSERITQQGMKLPFSTSLSRIIDQANRNTSDRKNQLKYRLFWSTRDISFVDRLENEIHYKISPEVRRFFGFENEVGDWATYYDDHRLGLLSVGFPKDGDETALIRTPEDAVTTIYAGYGRRGLGMELRDVKLASISNNHIVAAHYRRIPKKDRFELVSADVGIDAAEIFPTGKRLYGAQVGFSISQKITQSGYITEGMSQKTGQLDVVHADYYGRERGPQFYIDEFIFDDLNSVYAKTTQAKTNGFKFYMSEKSLRVLFNPKDSKNNSVNKQASSWQIDIPVSL